MSDGAKLVAMESRDLEDLELPSEVTQSLRRIKALVDAEYRQRFIEMAEALNRQAAALERVQTTLQILVQQLVPAIKDTVPAAFRVASESEEPDLATALVVADPIALGYTLRQLDVANALGISAPDASRLLRALKLNKDPDCAIEVRRGAGAALVNYHPRVIERIGELLRAGPVEGGQGINRICKQVADRLGVDASARQSASGEPDSA